jgi:DNA-binding transcriptional MerR regulator
MCGLSRSTLLYYDRIDLLKPVSRTSSGYRLYNNESLKQLDLISQYRKIGIKLVDIKKILDSRQSVLNIMLDKRLLDVENEIAELQKQKKLIEGLLNSVEIDKSRRLDVYKWIEILKASGMNNEDLSRWHAEFEKNTPEAHHAFLLWIGLSEKQVLSVRQGFKLVDP